jgi:adenosylcobyric acid synthase
LNDPAEVELADVLVLPGTKQTLDDLAWLRDQRFDRAIERYPGWIIGVCGGFQMLGRTIDDPRGVESSGVPRTMSGLGFLPIHTVLRDRKTVRRAEARTRLWNSPPFRGYEIHMGETRYENGAEPFAEILREGESEPTPDGAIGSSGRVWGSYLHGLFDDDLFRHGFLHFARQQLGLAPPQALAWVTSERDRRIDRWAAHLRSSLNMDLIHRWLDQA